MSTGEQAQGAPASAAAAAASDASVRHTYLASAPRAHTCGIRFKHKKKDGVP